MNLLSKFIHNKKIFGFAIFFLLILPILALYKGLVLDKNVKELSVLELNQGGRWTPESYEPYKLDKVQVQ